jgi:hypothetical protein
MMLLTSLVSLTMVLWLHAAPGADAYAQRLRYQAPNAAAYLHNTQSKIVAISLPNISFVGEAANPLLRPTTAEAWFVRQSNKDRVLLQLRPGNSWLPPEMTFQTLSRWPLVVHGFESAGGRTIFPVPVIVAYIVPDVKGATCDDSCVSALDGVCSDPLWQRSSYSPDVTGIPECGEGTDCTDCGGMERAGTLEICSDTCRSAQDGVCDDGRGTGLCADGMNPMNVLPDVPNGLRLIFSFAGTDCVDCGPHRPAESPQLVTSQSEAQDLPQTWTMKQDAKLAVCTAALVAITLVVGLLVGVRYRTVGESASLISMDALGVEAGL